MQQQENDDDSGADEVTPNSSASLAGKISDRGNLGPIIFALVGVLALAVFINYVLLDHSKPNNSPPAQAPESSLGGGTAAPLLPAAPPLTAPAVAQSSPSTPAKQSPPDAGSATTTAGSRIPSINIASELAKAWLAVDQKRWAEARLILANLKKAAPEDAEVWLAQGTMELRLGNYDAAIIALEKAVRIKPNLVQAYKALGIAHTYLGHDAEATKAIQEEVRLAFSRPHLDHFIKGGLHEQRGDYQSAIEEYKSAIRLKPDDGRNYYVLGNAYAKTGQDQEATGALETAVRLAPRDGDAHRELGRTYARMGRNAQAVQSLRTAIRLDPQDADAHAVLGVAYLMAQRTSEAVEVLARSVKLKPDSALAQFNLGLAHAAMKNWPQAAQAWEATTRLKPDAAVAYKKLGSAYSLMGRYTDAVSAMTKAAQLDPNDAEPHQGLALAYLALGNRVEAMKSYESLRQLNPGLALEMKPLFESEPDSPQGPRQDTSDKEDYIFEELPNIQLALRFDLGDLTMGQWSYKAFRVTGKKDGTTKLAIMLQIELQTASLSLPPLTVDVQAMSKTNRTVGSGFLLAKRIGVMEKLPYMGIILVDSFSDIDTISIRRGM